MKVVMEVPLTLDPGRVQYNSSRRMNEADERHTPRQSTYPAASLKLGIAWITHTPRGVHRLHQTLVGLENDTLSDLGVNRVGQVMAVLGLDSPAPDTLARRDHRSWGPP